MQCILHQEHTYVSDLCTKHMVFEEKKQRRGLTYTAKRRSSARTHNREVKRIYSSMPTASYGYHSCTSGNTLSHSGPQERQHSRFPLKQAEGGHHWGHMDLDSSSSEVTVLWTTQLLGWAWGVSSLYTAHSWIQKIKTKQDFTVCQRQLKKLDGRAVWEHADTGQRGEQGKEVQRRFSIPPARCGRRVRANQLVLYPGGWLWQGSRGLPVWGWTHDDYDARKASAEPRGWAIPAVWSYVWF